MGDVACEIVDVQGETGFQDVEQIRAESFGLGLDVAENFHAEQRAKFARQDANRAAGQRSKCLHALDNSSGMDISSADISFLDILVSERAVNRGEPPPRSCGAVTARRERLSYPFALAEGECHGYSIGKEVEASTRGTIKLGPGTLSAAQADGDRRVDPRNRAWDRRPDATAVLQALAVGPAIAQAEASRLEDLVRSRALAQAAAGDRTVMHPRSVERPRTMDVVRERKRRLPRYALPVASLLVLCVMVAYALNSLTHARAEGPVVDRATIVTDVARRGMLVRAVSAPGAFKAEFVRVPRRRRAVSSIRSWSSPGASSSPAA